MGPGALTGDWRRFWHLTFNIAVMQWKVRFYGSALGYLWQLVRPLLLFLVLYVFFTQIAHVGTGAGPSYDYYGAQLLSSIVLFTFFAEATMGAVRSVVANETLVRKIQFPRMAIPLSVVLLAFFNLCLNLIVVTIFALAAGVRPMLTWLEVPLIVGLLVVLSAGLAMLLSSLFVYLRDIEPIWEVLSQVIFYASPVIIPVTKVQAAAESDVDCTSTCSTRWRSSSSSSATRSSLTPPRASGALLGSTAAIAVPVAIVVAIFVLGFWVFNRIAPRVAEDL